MLLNFGVGEDSWESLGLQDQTSQSWKKSVLTDAEAEAPILWPADAKNQLFGKDPDAGKDWRQEKWTIDEEMVGWHHWLSVHELEKTPGDGEGQGPCRGAVHGVAKGQTWLSDRIRRKRKNKNQTQNQILRYFALFLQNNVLHLHVVRWTFVQMFVYSYRYFGLPNPSHPYFVNNILEVPLPSFIIYTKSEICYT